MANLFSHGREPSERPYGPTHYQTRSTKLRLFGLVAALVLVLTVAERARDPKSWAWFEILSKPQPIDSTGVETLLRKPLATADSADTLVLVDEKQASQEVVEDPDSATAAPEDAVARAWRLGWKEIYGGLDFEQKSLLYDLLGTGTGRSQLSPADDSKVETLLPLLTQRWEDYTNRAFQSLAAIDDTEKSPWIEILRQINARQKEELAPLLSALATKASLSVEQQKALESYQQVLDSIALQSVTDDSVLRPAENQIYFRLIAEPLSVKPTDTSSITFLQLLKQPEDYRGKPITIRGRVKGVSRAPASKNRCGIQDIYSYWLMLEDGPTSPILIRSIKQPEGFPPFEVEAGKSEQRLQEDIVLRGYFFKRFAYQAKDGTRTVPLILATQATWLPSAFLTDKAAQDPLANNWGFILSATLGISLLAVLGIYLAAFRSKASDKTVAAPQSLQDLEKFPVPLSSHEALRKLEEESQSAGPYPEDASTQKANP